MSKSVHAYFSRKDHLCRALYILAPVVALTGGCTDRAPSITTGQITATVPQVASVNTPVSFSGNCGISGAVTTLLTFGDGQSSSTFGVQHTYSQAGTYEVTFTCTSQSGATTQQTVELVVSRPALSGAFVNLDCYIFPPSNTCFLATDTFYDNIGIGTETATENMGGVLTVNDEAGTFSYALDAGGLLTLTRGGGVNNTWQGAVLREQDASLVKSGIDNDAFLLTKINSANDQSTPDIELGIKPASSASSATITGPYTIVSLGWLPAGSGASLIGTLADVTADGDGNFVGGTRTVNDYGGISVASFTATYEVSSAGVLTSGILSGAVGQGGNVFLLTSIHSGDAASFMAGVKRGTDESTATLGGSYTAVWFGDQEGRLYNSLRFDGHGRFAGSFIDNNIATVTTVPTSGSYSVTSDGRLSFNDDTGAASVGGVSVDGSVFVLTCITDEQTPCVMVGLRQSTN